MTQRLTQELTDLAPPYYYYYKDLYNNSLNETKTTNSGVGERGTAGCEFPSDAAF